MQDELVKHTRKIFSSVKQKEVPTMKKFKEVAIEVAIIVFAVSLSIWLHSYKEHRKEQHEVRVFLENIRVDISKDLESFTFYNATYKEMNVVLRKFVSYTPRQVDSLKRSSSEIGYPMIVLASKPNCGTYEGFKSSGKLGYIQNETLKKKVLDYYQQDVLNTIDLNNLYFQYLYKSLDILAKSAGDVSRRESAYREMRMNSQFLISFGEIITEMYDKSTIKDARELVKEIDRELKRME